MSDPDAPYDAPTDPSPPPEVRPTSVTVVAALSVALGLLGLLGVLSSCGGLALNVFGADLLAQGSSAQQEAQAALFAKGRPLTGLSAGLTLAVVPLAIMLFAGGAMLLASRPIGARWLRRAFTYGLILEPLRLLVQVVSVIYLWDETVAVAAAASAGMGGETTTMIVAISTGLGVLMSGLWMITKVAFYLLGGRTLSSEAALDWTAGATG